jgi:hypothetical protein
MTSDPNSETRYFDCDGSRWTATFNTGLSYAVGPSNPQMPVDFKSSDGAQSYAGSIDASVAHSVTGPVLCEALKAAIEIHQSKQP